MTPSEIVKELKAGNTAFLRQLPEATYAKLISFLDRKYFSDNKPVLSDAVYDIVRRTFNTRFPNNPTAKAVGSGRGADVKLVEPMPSLDQYQLGSSKLGRALKTPGPYCVAEKIDGQSIEIVYENGVPTKAFTRGDATHGTDISRHIPSFKIPKRLTGVPYQVVRFEAVIPTSTFDRYLHKDVGGKYVAARNAAGGMINSKTSIPELKHVRMVALEILAGTGAGEPLSKQYKQLAAQKFAVPVIKRFKALTEDKLVSLLEQFIAEADYEIDGIVVTLDKPYKRVGAQNPTHAFKFKMNAEASMAIVPCTGVVYQASKFGVLTPVVTYEPTKLAGGAVCQRATGHNGFFIEHGYLKDKKNAGKKPMPIGKGAMLKIVRSGSVIPYIVEVVKAARKPDLPLVPFTRKGVDFIAEQGHVDTEVRARRIADFFAFTGVKNVGLPTVTKLVNSEYSSLTAILSAPVSDMATIIGSASRAQELRRGIDNVLFGSGVTIEALFKGLGAWYLEGMGIRNWEKILPLLPNNIAKLATMPSSEVLRAISGVTELKSMQKDIAASVPKMAKVISKLGIRIRVIKATSSKMKDQVVLFTGFRDNDLKERLIAAGAKVAGGYSAAVTLVIASDPNESSTKLDKARAAGKKIVSRAEMEKQL